MSARRATSLLAAGLLVAGLAGCGDDDDPPPEPRAGPSAPVEWRAVLATSNAPAPDSLVLQQFASLDCASPPAPAAPQEVAVACDADGVKYSLEPAVTVGGVASAEAGVPEGESEPVVDVRLDDEASAALRELTGDLVAGQQVALVLDGEVLAAPAFEEPVEDGRVRVTEAYLPGSAGTLVDRLRGS